MKKVFFIAFAASALMLASCGNNSKPAANVDSTADTTAVADTSTTAAAPDDVNALTSQLGSKLSAKDAKGVSALLTSAKAKVAKLAKENPEQAKQYVSQLQKWISDNAATIKNLVSTTGNSTLSNAVTTAVGAVSSINPDKVVSSLASAAQSDAKAAGEQLLNSAKSGAEQAVKDSKVGQTVEKAQEVKKAIDEAPAKAQQKANEAVNKAQQKANDAVQKAQKKANDKVNEAANKALKGLGL